MLPDSSKLSDCFRELTVGRGGYRVSHSGMLASASSVRPVSLCQIKRHSFSIAVCGMVFAPINNTHSKIIAVYKILQGM